MIPDILQYFLDHLWNFPKKLQNNDLPTSFSFRNSSKIQEMSKRIFKMLISKSRHLRKSKKKKTKKVETNGHQKDETYLQFSFFNFGRPKHNRFLPRLSYETEFYNGGILMNFRNLKFLKQKFGKSENLKAYANPIKANYFEKLLSCCQRCFIFLGPKQWSSPRPFQRKRNFTMVESGSIIEIQTKSSKGVPSTHQHTDSHTCTRPVLSRSLSEWSRKS